MTNTKTIEIDVRRLKDLEHIRETILWTQDLNIDNLTFEIEKQEKEGKGNSYMTKDNWELTQEIIKHWRAYVFLNELIESLEGVKK